MAESIQEILKQIIGQISSQVQIEHIIEDKPVPSLRRAAPVVQKTGADITPINRNSLTPKTRFPEPEIQPEQTSLIQPEADIKPESSPRVITPKISVRTQKAAALAAAVPEVALPPEMEALRNKVSTCEKCSLCQTRHNVVFGVGNPRAELVFVGEAPGEDEDIQGVPFVGRAGQLLTQMVEEPRSLGIKRSDVYICNVLKCRPPENRNPEPHEIDCCEPYLKLQLELIKPKVICTLGKFASQTLLKSQTTISQLRGKWFEYEGIPLLPSFHPSYLLRNASAKKESWQDMLALRNKIDELRDRPD